jgi:hypothetical protein
LEFSEPRKEDIIEDQEIRDSFGLYPVGFGFKLNTVGSHWRVFRRKVIW